MVTIHFSSRFKRSYKKLPPEIREDFKVKIEILRNYPFDPKLKIHRLQGKLSTYYAFSLRGGNRVLLEFEEPDVVLLVNIGRHDDYVKWSKK